MSKECKSLVGIEPRNELRPFLTKEKLKGIYTYLV